MSRPRTAEKSALTITLNQGSGFEHGHFWPRCTVDKIVCHLLPKSGKRERPLKIEHPILVAQKCSTNNYRPERLSLRVYHLVRGRFRPYCTGRRGVHFGVHPFQPAQICAGSLVGQNCPANPGNVAKVRFMSLLYHAWLHRKIEWQFVFYAVSERKISRNTVEML